MADPSKDASSPLVSFTDTKAPMRDRMESYIKSLQHTIITALESLDNAAPKFVADSWVRPEGGMGTSCVMSGGNVFERAGVNVSIVHGKLPPPAIKQMRADHAEIPYDPESGESLPFFAAGISLVVHPRNPFVPTVHLNYRYFEITPAAASKDAPPSHSPSPSTSSIAPGTASGLPPASPPATAPPTPAAWWFGGGSDLTPSYLFEEDCNYFHSALKAACDAHGATLYPTFKDWCDTYFYIPHRKESRGIGGIFFDDLSSAPHSRLKDPNGGPDQGYGRPKTPEEIFAFVRSCGDAFVGSYIPIVQRRMDMPYTETHRRWQLLRRGRYVEFNLVYDRGTKFGLQTPGARIESILMSLPETARWEYMTEMGAEGSEEGRLLEVLKNHKAWV